MTTSIPSNQALRDLWLLGRRFAAFTVGSGNTRVKPKSQLLQPPAPTLESLGVTVDAASLGSAKPAARRAQLEASRAQIAEAAARHHGPAARPVFALGEAAMGLDSYANEETPTQRPDLLEGAKGPAASFLAAYQSSEEPVRSELEELAGWCEAITSGRAGLFWDVHELAQLLEEPFREGAAPEAPEPEADPAYDFRTAPLDHVRKMIVLHQVLCIITSIRYAGGSSSMFRGDLQAGIHAYDDISESNFAVAWDEQGIVGLAFHKYAEGTDGAHWLGKLPAALEPLAAKLPRGHGWTCGFWITHDRRHRAEYSGEHDGSDYIDAFTSSARATLLTSKDNWAASRSLTEDQADVALALADRAMSGGGAITEEETDILVTRSAGEPESSFGALNEEQLRRVQAAFAQIGLAWTLPTAALERERAVIRQRVEEAIRQAMSPDERALFQAARHNDAGAVKALLSRGINTEVASVVDQFEGIPFVPGMPPLHIAIRSKATEAALTLLEGGANVEHDVHGLTPLVCAVQANDLAVARACLAHGAKPKSSPRMHLVAIAAGQNHTDMVRLLVDSGADLPPPQHAAQMLAHLRKQGHVESAELIEAALAARG